jgi:hypothetical protein
MGETVILDFSGQRQLPTVLIARIQSCYLR